MTEYQRDEKRQGGTRAGKSERGGRKESGETGTERDRMSHEYADERKQTAAPPYRGAAGLNIGDALE